MATNYPIKGDADKKIGAYFAPLSVSAQDTPNLTVKIRAGAFFNSQNELVEYSGGNSSAFTVPSSGTRWSIIGLNDAGSITIIHGVESGAPSVPTLPAGVLPLAAVYMSSSTTSISNPMVHDIRPFIRSIDNVPDLAAELADRPTFTDVNNSLASKADVDGTPDLEFALNKDFLTGTPNDNITLSVKRGASSDVAIRWNEGLDVWEFTNDGVTYNAFVSSVGTFAPIVHTHTASDVTDFATAVDARIGVAVIPQSQVTNLVADLATKASDAAFTAHAANAGIHFSLPITEADVTNLTTDLAAKVDKATPGVIGATSGVLTVQSTGNQPIALNSSDTGSSGVLVDRTAAGFPATPARLEWDESTDAWLIGVTGAMDTVLTDTIVSTKADKVVGAVNGNIATLDGTGNLVDSAVAITDVVLDTRSVIAGTGLSGGGDLSANRTFDLANTTVVAASYGSATAVATFTVDAQGRLTAAADVSIAIPQSAVTNLTTDLAAKLDDVPTAVDGNIVSWASTGTVLADSGIAATAVALKATTLTAGIGLTGGGDLSANRTFDIEAVKGTAAVTFGAIATNDVGDSSNTITVTGAVVGDTVTVGFPSTVPAGFTYNAYVSASDTVTVRAHGSAASGTGAGAADATINVIVFKYAGF